MKDYSDDWEPDIDTSLLQERPKYIPVLQKLVSWEENNDNYKSWLDDKPFDIIWQVGDVKVNGSTLHQLNMAGYVEKPYESNSKTYYSLTDRETIKELLEDYNISDDGTMQTKVHEFPDDHAELDGLFDDVVGYEDVKWMLKRAITTQEITNIILYGPTGSAKTVFLMCIEENLDDSVFMSGKPSSGPGVLDKLFTKTPKYMLIDEMDDMNTGVQQVLSQYTETGIVDETKVGKDRKLKTNTKTFGSANYPEQIIDQVNDRFLDLHFEPYTYDEFVEICQHILPKREGTEEDNAELIANEVWNIEGGADIRKAVQVARLSRGDPERVISVLKNYTDEETASKLPSV